MDCFIKKISEGKTDKYVHIQFQKFSRGEFRNKALINGSISKGAFKISTSPEYASELIQIVADKLKDDERTRVTGIIVSTMALEGEVEYEGKSQFMGVKKYSINKDMNKKEIIGLCEKLPLAFIGLSFKAGETELKIKQKMPKSSKPSNKDDEKPKVDFCVLVTKDKEILKKIIFDYPNFKKISINHDFLIEEIKIPKDEKDPVKMRENAIRLGKIKRKIEVDGNKFEKEFRFEA
jgi:hypothetical protein